MSESFLDGKVTLHRGDCLDILPTLGENSIDSCVTDPPYHLTSIVKRFGKPNSAECQYGSDGAYARASKGFMGKQWDGGDIAFRPELWAEVLRVLKPGAHVLAFGGTRTYHALATAIEAGGFEVRDALMWHYGQGFPKSHNIGNGWGTALKPATEIICLARKPLSESSIASNVLKHGTGGINVDGCRIGTSKDVPASPRRATQGPAYGDLSKDPGTGSGWDKNIGRWPANLIHDGSEEVVSGFPESGPGPGNVHLAKENGGGVFGGGRMGVENIFKDSGSAARFFYTAKADADDRLGSKHPTVKPLDLMSYLTRLVTPAGGIVLDPFAGTGTTAEAAFREGLRCILIEREQEYQADIVKRMGLCLSGPDERRANSVKQVGLEDTPLFGGVA